MSSKLTLEADLEVLLDGEPVEVQAHGDTITVNVGGLSTLQKMFRLWRSQRSDKGGLDLLRALDWGLKHGGLSLAFQVKGKTLAHLGAGEKSGLGWFLSKVLGLDSAE